MSVYTDLVNSMIGLNLESINTQETVSDLNTSLTEANQTLCANWTTCPESNPNDPGHQAYLDLQGIGTGHPNKMTSWINKYLGSPTYHASDFSSFFMTQVYQTYLNNQPSNPNPAVLTLISDYSNLISSAAQSDEQPGQNAISTLNTLAQHFESDQGPLQSASTTILDGVNNYSSAMQSITA